MFEEDIEDEVTSAARHSSGQIAGQIHCHSSVRRQSSDPVVIGLSATSLEGSPENARQAPLTNQLPTSSSKPEFSRQSSQDMARSSPLHAATANEVNALRKHIKVLEERLRNERHSHAVKFSEVEKQIIQENAKLKVSTSALQRQIKREQQLVLDHEAELTKLKKERKSRFSIAGINRSFSDAKLEDMEMKESSLKRNITESEVVRMIKERLDDSEKDRLEGEALFNQRISTLLRERNLQRADMQSAEETIMKLNSENQALQTGFQELRTYLINNSIETVPPYPDKVNQVKLLKRSKQQLQEELDHLTHERSKLLTDLEELSEELTLLKANKRQAQAQNSTVINVKQKIDSLRNQLSSLDRLNHPEPSRISFARQDSSDDSLRSFTSNEPRPTSFDAAAVPRPPNLEAQLRQKTQELNESNERLTTILEVSRRYEQHCYQLEKELHKVYGEGYHFVETEWRKKDVSIMKKIKDVIRRDTGYKPNQALHAEVIPQTVSTSAMTQTVSPPAGRILENSQMDDLSKKVDGMIKLVENIPLRSSPVVAHNHAERNTMAEALGDVLKTFREIQMKDSDLTKLTAAKLEIQTLQRTFEALQKRNVELENWVGQSRGGRQHQQQVFEEEDSDRPITQEEIDERIRQAHMRVAKLEAAGLLPEVPVVGETNTFAYNESAITNFTSDTSGVWTSPWSSGSSKKEEFVSPSFRPRAATFY